MSQNGINGREGMRNRHALGWVIAKLAQTGWQDLWRQLGWDRIWFIHR
jgi:hypothetical protein